MNDFRYSIAAYILVMTLFSFGLLAYVSEWEIAGTLAYSVYLFLLCLTSCGAFLSSGASKRFCLGFAVFGWCYWCLGFETAAPMNRAPVLWNYSGVQQPPPPKLITTDILEFTEKFLAGGIKVGDSVMAVWRNGGIYRGTVTELTDDGLYVIKWDDGSAPQPTQRSQVFPLKTHSRVAGHSVLGSLVALIGGIAAAILFTAKEEMRASPKPTPDS